MTFTYTRFLSRLSTSVLKKYSRKFTYLYSGINHPPPASGILRRCFCEKPVDLYAAINEDDFEIYDQTSNYKDIDFESIAKGDPETLKTLKKIQLEIDIFAQEGGQVPNGISSSNWLKLLSYPSRSQRMKHIRFLWLNESRKLSKKLRQTLHRNELENLEIPKLHRTDLSTNSPMEYGLLRNTLFHRFYDPDMKNLYNWRLLQVEMFGPHLVIDCGYDEFMNVFDLSMYTKDVLKSWSDNREHFYPFDMIFCNLKQNSNSLAKLCSVLPAIERDPMCPFNYTDKHYLDLFPKEKLVYLTPHCTEVMESFDGDSIYIIGKITLLILTFQVSNFFHVCYLQVDWSIDLKTWHFH